MLDATRQASIYIVPVLLTAYVLLRAVRSQKAFEGPALRLVVLLAAVPLALIKISGFGIVPIVRAVSPSYSVVTMGLLAVLVIYELQRRPVMRKMDWAVFFSFNALLGAYLYTSVLGLASSDVYPLGYGFNWIFVVTAGFTIVLALMKNPLALAYAVAIGAWDIRLLAHSRNYFDYIMDGPLFFFSVVGIVVLGVRAARSKRSD